MSDTNTPQGIDVNTAQNAIMDMIAPKQDTASSEPEALEVEAEEVIEVEAEMPEEEATNEEVDTDGELEATEEAEELEDQSFDILAQTVEVEGEEITVEELKRGNLRQRDYTRKTQELAEARREMEAQNAEVVRERQQYAQLLPALAERLEQQVVEEPDWDTLYDADPNMARKAERQFRKQKEEREAQLQAIRAERERIQVLEAENQERMKAEFTARQREMLPEIIPEWRDTKVAQKEATDLRSFLLKEGFLEADINELRHAGLVKIARMAMMFDQGQSKAVKAKAKPKPKAKTMKTGTRGTQPRPKAASEQALQRARQTGRVQDAAAAINNLLGG
jgi:hypothetical protein